MLDLARDTVHENDPNVDEKDPVRVGVRLPVAGRCAHHAQTGRDGLSFRWRQSDSRMASCT